MNEAEKKGRLLLLDQDLMELVYKCELRKNPVDSERERERDLEE